MKQYWQRNTKALGSFVCVFFLPFYSFIEVSLTNESCVCVCIYVYFLFVCFNWRCSRRIHSKGRREWDGLRVSWKHINYYMYVK